MIEDTQHPFHEMEQTPAPQDHTLDVMPVMERAQMVREQLAKVIVGQQAAIDLLLNALFVGGHVLIEGVPGIAKRYRPNSSRNLLLPDSAGFSLRPT